jgi:hypothetical protein
MNIIPASWVTAHFVPQRAQRNPSHQVGLAQVLIYLKVASDSPTKIVEESLEQHKCALASSTLPSCLGPPTNGRKRFSSATASTMLLQASSRPVRQRYDRDGDCQLGPSDRFTMMGRRFSKGNASYDS